MPWKSETLCPVDGLPCLYSESVGKMQLVFSVPFPPSLGYLLSLCPVSLQFPWSQACTSELHSFPPQPEVRVLLSTIHFWERDRDWGWGGRRLGDSSQKSIDRFFFQVPTFTACAIPPFYLKPFYSSVLTAHRFIPKVKVINRPIQISPPWFGTGPGFSTEYSSSWAEGQVRSVTCRTASTFGLFSSQDKENGSLSMPAQAILLFRLSFLGLSAMGKLIEPECPRELFCSVPAEATQLTSCFYHRLVSHQQTSMWVSYQQQSQSPKILHLVSHSVT